MFDLHLKSSISEVGLLSRYLVGVDLNFVAGGRVGSPPFNYFQIIYHGAPPSVFVGSIGLASSGVPSRRALPSLESAWCKTAGLMKGLDVRSPVGDHSWLQ